MLELSLSVLDKIKKNVLQKVLGKSSQKVNRTLLFEPFQQKILRSDETSKR